MLYKGIATDNLPNRNGGRFSLDELKTIVALLPDVPISIDHSYSFTDRKGFIVSANLVQKDLDPLPEAIKSEGYWTIEVEANIEGVSPIPLNGDGLSISTLYKKERCPDCDCQVENWTSCPRSIEAIEAAGYIERVGVTDVLEVSLVLIPAVKNAKLGNTATPSPTISQGEDSVSNPKTSDSLKPMSAQDVVTATPAPMRSKDSVAPTDTPTVETASTPNADVPEQSEDMGCETEEDPAEEPMDAEDVEEITLSAEEIEMLQQQAAELENLKQEIKTMAEKYAAAEAAAVLAAADAAQKVKEANQAAAKAKLKTKLGIAMPMVNTTAPATSSDRLQGQGLLKEWQDVLTSADSRQVVYANGARIERQRDESDAFRLWRDNRKAIRQEIQKAAKSDGFLLGSRDASTSKADIAPYLLDHLSMMIRISHQSRRVWWQFPTMMEDFMKGPGDTIQVPRWTYLTEPTAEADFTLTPGTDLNTSLQNIGATEVPLTVEEKGLGKAGVAGQEPVGIPEFWMARSLENLENRVMMLLGQHYEASIDLMIRKQYQTTTAIWYNDNGEVTTTPGNLTTGDDGTLTTDFAHSVFSAVSGAKVPPLADGCYAWVIHSHAAGQLRKSLGDQAAPATRQDVEDITNILQLPAEQGQVSGYIGKHCNIHFFETNAHSLGAAGTEGAQNATLGVGSTLTRSSWIFGLGAVGRGIGMQPQVRRDSSDNYGRLGKFVWLSHETAGTLDVDPNNDPSEQQRVWEIRTTDRPI